MFRGVFLLPAALALALVAAPTSAQGSFEPGDTVVAAPGAADAACMTEGGLERYNSAREMCQEGDASECQVVKDLESQGVCGFHYGVYVVTATTPQLGWIQISPTSDRSLVYWAEARDFLPSQ